jgi:hypothetical protein
MGENLPLQPSRNISADSGINHVKIPPDAHAQNGRVERVHLTILNLVRTLLLDSKLPTPFGAEAASYACYMRNHTPCGPKGEIPDDKWCGKQKSHDHLHPFGQKAFYRFAKSSSKLSARYTAGIVLGYVEGTTNYRVWDKNQPKAIITRDVAFVRSPEASMEPIAHCRNLSVFSEDKEQAEDPIKPLRKLAAFDLLSGHLREGDTATEPPQSNQQVEIS